MNNTPRFHKTVTLIAFGANGGQSLFVNARRIVAARFQLERLYPQGRWHHARLWRSPAWPPGSGPDFVNSVSLFDRPIQPACLLRDLHRLEAQAGRTRTIRWGPRSLDLDLLSVASSVRPSPQVVRDWINLPPHQQAVKAPEHLILPHPRLQDRAFVLAPLCDIAPNWRHPLTGQTARAMMAALPDEQRTDIKPLRFAL